MCTESGVCVCVGGGGGGLFVPQQSTGFGGIPPKIFFC